VLVASAAFCGAAAGAVNAIQGDGVLRVIAESENAAGVGARRALARFPPQAERGELSPDELSEFSLGPEPLARDAQVSEALVQPALQLGASLQSPYQAEPPGVAHLEGRHAAPGTSGGLRRDADLDRPP